MPGSAFYHHTLILFRSEIQKKIMIQEFRLGTLLIGCLKVHFQLRLKLVLRRTRESFVNQIKRELS